MEVLQVEGGQGRWLGYQYLYRLKKNSNHDRFRWVVCQLEVLCNCLKLPALRQKLKELPETLDETYNRILLSIPENCHYEAHAVLQWLAYSRRPMNVAEVAEAIAVDRIT